MKRAVTVELQPIVSTGNKDSVWPGLIFPDKYQSGFSCEIFWFLNAGSNSYMFGPSEYISRRHEA